MRCAFLIAGIIAALLATTAVNAAEESGPRSFGTIPCQQRFSCEGLAASQAEEMANTCAVRGFGLQASQSDIFSSSSLDSNNCMDGQLPATDNTMRSMTAHCCVIRVGDDCTMNCQLLMH